MFPASDLRSTTLSLPLSSQYSPGSRIRRRELPCSFMAVFDLYTVCTYVYVSKAAQALIFFDNPVTY
jgi:hypothetical protein